jgi:hypothetical protein
LTTQRLASLIENETVVTAGSDKDQKSIIWEEGMGKGEWKGLREKGVNEHELCHRVIAI